MQQKADEKIDPLTRIQEEIKEVVRREQEYRQLATSLSITPTPPIQVEIERESERESDFESYTVNLNGNGNIEGHVESSEEQLGGVLVTAQPAAIQCATTTSLLVPLDNNSPSNTPSLTSSVNSNKEESLDGQHSDDSGISASSLSLKINNNNNNNGKLKQFNNNNNNSNNNNEAPLKLNIMGRHDQRYIGPNCYNMTPEPPQQKLMTRTISTPQLSGGQQKRQFAFNSSTKGVMQRFIASHGKVQLGSGSGMGMGMATLPLSNGHATPIISNGGGSQTLKLNTRNALAFLEAGGNDAAPTNTLSPAAIERDSEGRPLRRGYVPVEQKIQRELQDLKSRETELKRLRKINRQNTLKLSLDKLQLSTDDEADVDDDVQDDEDEDSEVEHCYGPGKLRNAQSTMELDSADVELSYKTSGNRSLNVVNGNGSGAALAGGMRPAMSLAQLCDLTPEEAPSSHRLIAQWESLIKKNAEGGAAIEAAI